MSKIRLALASLLLASSLGACVSSSAVVPVKPIPTNKDPMVVDRAKLRAKLAERREVNFGRFLAYREGRIYPRAATPGTQHIWFDASGNLCAAATVISGDWGVEPTKQIGAKNLAMRIADVKSGVLADWILMSGLTKYELVAIQAPMVYPDPQPEYPITMEDPEITRLYTLYTDVERQLRSLWDANLDAATDALMKRPDLARELMNDRVASPGGFKRTDMIAGA